MKGNLECNQSNAVGFTTLEEVHHQPLALGGSIHPWWSWPADACQVGESAQPCHQQAWRPWPCIPSLSAWTSSSGGENEGLLQSSFVSNIISCLSTCRRLSKWMIRKQFCSLSLPSSRQFEQKGQLTLRGGVQITYIQRRSTEYNTVMLVFKCHYVILLSLLSSVHVILRTCQTKGNCVCEALCNVLLTPKRVYKIKR